MRFLKFPISCCFLIFTFCTWKAIGQKEYTAILGRENSYCNGSCILIDIPDLNGNPQAVILVTPLTQELNPHPVGVYYVPEKKRWSVINQDQAHLMEGAQFRLVYYAQPESGNQFVFVVGQKNLKNNSMRSYIDHPAMNNNPAAQFQFIANGVGYNRYEISIQYDNAAAKWYISNTNNKALANDIAYNIVLANGAKTAINPVSTAVPGTSTNDPLRFGTADICLMTVTGKQQGIFRGESLPNKQQHETAIFGFHVENSTPSVTSSSQSKGRRFRSPITISKFFGASSVQFLQAFLEGETLLTVVFIFYSNELNIPVYTVTIKNVKVIGVKQDFGDAPNPLSTTGRKGQLVDSITLDYEKIEMVDGTGYITIDDVFTGN